MSDLPEKDEIKSISGKVLAFGMTTVLLMILVICGCLLLALYSMSSRYLTQMKIAQERQATVFALQRSLDHVHGKLAVYEEFITDRREDIVQKVIVKYLRNAQAKSTDVTLNEFEKWVGVGGR